MGRFRVFSAWSSAGISHRQHHYRHGHPAESVFITFISRISFHNLHQQNQFSSPSSAETFSSPSSAKSFFITFISLISRSFPRNREWELRLSPPPRVVPRNRGWCPHPSLLLFRPCLCPWTFLFALTGGGPTSNLACLRFQRVFAVQPYFVAPGFERPKRSSGAHVLHA